MEVLTRHARELGIDLTPQQLKAFAAYERELLDWNTRFNLTAITQEDQIQIRHFLDSLTCLVALKRIGWPQTRAADAPFRVVDVGSGAGFPGVPLKIVCPRWQVTLVEATGKKVTFLEHLRDLLGLKGLEIIHGRAEEVGRDPAHREQYDLAVARAVAEMPALAELLLPFVKIGGLAMAMKAATAEAETTAAEKGIGVLGGELVKIVSLELPTLAEPRRLVTLRKVARTPDIYPRRPGVPTKRPLQ